MGMRWDISLMKRGHYLKIAFIQHINILNAKMCDFHLRYAKLQTNFLLLVYPKM